MEMAASLSALGSLTTGWEMNSVDPLGGSALFGSNALVAGGAMTVADRYLGAIDRTVDRIDLGTSTVAYSLGAAPQVGTYGRFGSIGPAGARVYDIARQFGYFGPASNVYSANTYLGLLRNMVFGGVRPSMGAGIHDPRAQLGQPIRMGPQMQAGGYPQAAPAVPPTPPPQEREPERATGPRLHEPPVEKITVPAEKPKVAAEEK